MSENPNEAATDPARSNVLGGLREVREKYRERARGKLARAGVERASAASILIAARFALSAIIGAIAVAGVYWLGWVPEWTTFRRYSLIIGALIVGYRLPDVLVDRRIKAAATRRGDARAEDIPTSDGTPNRSRKQGATSRMELGLIAALILVAIIGALTASG